MARLPLVGGDLNTWGTVLNDFLAVSLNADGTIKLALIDPTMLNFDPATQAELNVVAGQAAGLAIALGGV
jgi:hypothetical protein